MNRIEKRFRPIVYPYLGSSMLINEEYDSVMDANANRCFQIHSQETVKFLKWLNDNEYSFYEGGLIRLGVKKAVLKYKDILKTYYDATHTTN